MKKGQIVIIYEDPITCQRREGEAKLVSQMRGDTGDGLELWEVKFINDGYETTRTVNVKTH